MDNLKVQLNKINVDVIDALSNPEVPVEDFYLPLLGLLRIFPYLLEKFTHEELAEIMLISMKDERTTGQKTAEEQAFQIADIILTDFIKKG